MKYLKACFDKRGSYTVFLTIFLCGLMIFIIAVIKASANLAIDSTTENFGRVWAKSIIAEYDRALKERYGFYGFYANEYMVEEKILYYAGKTTKGKDYLKTGECKVDLDGYKLMEMNTFLDQLTDTMLRGEIPNRSFFSAGETETEAGHRYIAADWIINSLPSKNKESTVNTSIILNRVRRGDSLSSLANYAMVNNYIFKYFNNYVDYDEFKENTFFKNEVEYIITGKLDDERARKNVYNDLVALRNGLNLAYLYGCEEKLNMVRAIAELLTPGPEAEATAAMLLEMWAYAEAKNDLALLYDKKTVPLTKGDQNWALGFGSILFGDSSGKNYVTPSCIEGIEYDKYLAILLATVSEKTRVLRIMDLIQINLKYAYCDYFLLEDYYVGLNYSLVVNGRSHEFTEAYKK